MTIKKQNGVRTKSYRKFDDHDDLRNVRDVLNSIVSGGVGEPEYIQCLVKADGYGAFRIKDITFDNEERCVYFHFAPDEFVKHPEYTPESDTGVLLFPKRR